MPTHPKSISLTLNSRADEVRVALTANTTGRTCSVECEHVYQVDTVCTIRMYKPPCMCVQALKWDTSGTSQHSTPHRRANLIGNSCKDLSAEQLPSCIVMATTICSLFHRDARPVSGYKEVDSTAHLAQCEWAGVQPALVLVTVRMYKYMCTCVCVCVCVCP